MPDLRDLLLCQDLVYVGGGNTGNLLAVWRVHHLDRLLREAYQAGVVLAGLSAGMNCWFEASITDSFDTFSYGPLRDGLGILQGSACPHYGGESERRPRYRELVRSGFPSGYAADDGAALRFVDETVEDVVTSRPSAAAYHVTTGAGGPRETRLSARFLD